MTRWSIWTLVATLVVSPWSGCDREPISPPASPPSERAPVDTVEQADPSGGIILLDAARRRG